MEIEQVGLSPADTGRIRACFEVMLAAERVDHPGEPWFTEQPFTGWITVGWDGSPREVWLATDQGQAVGWYRLDLPARENLDQGGLEIVVHPGARRRGTGGPYSTAARATAPRARRSPARPGPNPGWRKSSACSTSGSWRRESLPGCAARPNGRRPATRWCPGWDRYPRSSSNRRRRFTTGWPTPPGTQRSPTKNGTPSASANESTTCARTTGCAITRSRRGMTTPANWRR